MAQFSIGDAAVAGFREIGRHWRLVLGWGAFLLVGLIGLIVLVAVASVGLTASGAIAADGPGAAILGMLAVLGMTLLGVMVQSAAWRLLLKPGEAPGFLRLHLGPDELRLAAYLIVIGAIWFVLMLPWGIFRAAQPYAFWPGALVGLVLALVAAWLSLRLAFVMPMIVDRRRLAWTASWKLSHGRAGLMLGAALLTLVLLLLLIMAQYVVLGGVAVAAMGMGGLRALMSPDAASPGHALFSVIQIVVQMLLYPVYALVWQAPLAVAYRAFTGADEA